MTNSESKPITLSYDLGDALHAASRSRLPGFRYGLESDVRSEVDDLAAVRIQQWLL